ncbi:MAG: histidine phosphatase family protein, partial [Oscillospiraceae bacterium]|nr:histidine phosphatase family protein [Oscillospiraceae bacterium]
PAAKPIALDGLKEYFFGEFEDKTPIELEHHPLFARWLAGEPELVPPFAESLEDFQARLAETFVKVVDGLFKANVKHSVIVTHGGVVMALLAMFGLPEAPMHEWLTPGGCGFTMRVEPSVWMRGRKVEVCAMAPEEPQADELPEERRLWKEIEESEFI